MTNFQITKELARLQKLAKENKLNPEDIRGGTITLSNIGAIGGKSGSPIINVPEVAIIALGRTQKVARFGDDGNVYPVSLMTVTLSVAFYNLISFSTYLVFYNYIITKCHDGLKFILEHEIVHVNN